MNGSILPFHWLDGSIGQLSEYNRGMRYMGIVLDDFRSKVIEMKDDSWLIPRKVW